MFENLASVKNQEKQIFFYYRYYAVEMLAESDIIGNKMQLFGYSVFATSDRIHSYTEGCFWKNNTETSISFYKKPTLRDSQMVTNLRISSTRKKPGDSEKYPHVQKLIIGNFMCYNHQN